MAALLRQQGFQAWAIRGGYMAWRQAGYPTEPKATELVTAPEAACDECGQPLTDHVVPHAA